MDHRLDLGLFRAELRATSRSRSSRRPRRDDRSASCCYRNDRIYHLANEVASELKKVTWPTREGGSLGDDRRHRHGAHLRRSSSACSTSSGRTSRSLSMWITERSPDDNETSTGAARRRRHRRVGRVALGVAAASVADQAIAPPTAEKKWYIVNTYSGHENKAKLTLLERVAQREPRRVLRRRARADRERDGERQGPAPHDDPQVLPGLHVRPDGPGRPHVPPRQEHRRRSRASSAA